MSSPVQDKIVEELRSRISNGFYTDKLPKAELLAQEFQVNVKTLNKALARLVRVGMLERRRRFGTVVKRKSEDTDSKEIEIIYKGDYPAFSHPYWGPVFSGAVKAICEAGYTPLLNSLVSSNLLTEQIKNYKPHSCCGRLLFGVTDVRFFEILKKQPEPFVAACDAAVCQDAPQVSISAAEAIEHAMRAVCRNGFTRIAFIGGMQTFEDDCGIAKFRIWRDTIRNFCQVDPDLVVSTDPKPGNGRISAERLLENQTPEAIVIGFGTHLLEVCSVLRHAGLDIPVISCDGLLYPEYNETPQPIVLPLEQCGKMAAESLIRSFSTGGVPESKVLKARCCPEYIPRLK